MFLIEAIDNGFQLISLGVCLVLSLYQALSSRDQIWALLTMFYGAIILGNLYWFLYLIFYQETPYYSFIPDLSWISSYFFLFILLLQIRKSEWSWKKGLVSFLIPLFTFGMCLFYSRSGDYLTNIVYALFMCLLIDCSIKGLMLAEKKTFRYYLYFHCLVFCIVEYMLWNSSYFPGPYLYSLFDIALTIAYIIFYLLTGRFIRNELH